MELKKIKNLFLAVLAVTLLAAGCGAEKVETEKTYLVKKVIDGDTIELSNGKKVRYIGVDAPETRRKVNGRWVFDPEDHAVSAKEYNDALVYGTHVKLEFDEVRYDKYGRWLAYVYTDNGLMANAELVKQGLSSTYTFPPNVKYRKLLLEAQLDARKNKRGFWNTLKTISPGQAGECIGKFVIVKGRVSSVKVSPHEIFFHMGEDPKKNVTLTIYTNNLPFFLQDGVDPVARYDGQYVEAVGKVEYRDGPEICIDTPFAVTVLGEN